MIPRLRHKKWIVSLLIIVMIGGLIFLQSNWEMFQYKNGNRPVMMDRINGEDGFGERFLLKNRDNYIDDLDIGITDYYYVTGINQLVFGLWYKKWKYDNHTRVVDIEMVDDAGKIYPSHAYVILPGTGVYETFQSREIRGIDFESINTLTMKVRLTKEYNNDEEISIKIYDREKDELQIYNWRN